MIATQKNIQLISAALAELIGQERCKDYLFTRIWDGAKPGFCKIVLRKIENNEFVTLFQCELTERGVTP